MQQEHWLLALLKLEFYQMKNENKFELIKYI
jgi:hypothetical protein